MNSYERITTALQALPDHLGACLACGKVTTLEPDGICIDCYMTGGGDGVVEVRLDGINRGALLELAEEGCRSVGIPVSEARKLLEAHEYDLQHPGGESSGAA